MNQFLDSIYKFPFTIIILLFYQLSNFLLSSFADQISNTITKSF